MTTNEISDHARAIFNSAQAHEGRFLLRRRLREPKPWQKKNDVDRDYDACNELIDRGLARWERSMGPGIRLTGKQL